MKHLPQNIANYSLLPSSKVNVPLPFDSEIYLLSVTIAGINYNKENIKEILLDEKLILQRESNNKYDKYAIVVNLSSKKKVGYIPKKDNKVFARLMDAGKFLYAVVSQIDYDNEKIKEVKIKIFLKDV